MHYGIFTYGSRGDVQPYIALSLGLIRRGHQVTLAANENFKDLVESFGISFHPLTGNSYEFHHQTEFDQIHRTGSKLSLLKLLYNTNKGRSDLQDDIITLCKKTDVVVINYLISYMVSSAAEKFKLKWAVVLLNPPIYPTREFPAPHLDQLDLPIYNLFSYRLISWIFHHLYIKETNVFRQTLGMEKMRGSILKVIAERKIPFLHNYSTAIISRPADWPSHCVISGFFDMDHKKAPASANVINELVEWLNEGTMPIFISYGSIPVPNIDKFGSILKEILSESNYRIIFCSGWTDLGAFFQHPRLFTLKEIDSEWIFPKCKAAILHGGIGTLAAALRAGLPVIINSIYTDQPLWGKIIEKKKLGVHLPWKHLTKKKLLNALNYIVNEHDVEINIAISKKIRSEDGVNAAISVLENYFEDIS